VQIKYSLCRWPTEFTPSLDGCQYSASRCCHFNSVPLFERWCLLGHSPFVSEQHQDVPTFAYFLCLFCVINVLCVRAANNVTSDLLIAVAGLVTFAVTNRHGVILPKVRKLWMGLWWAKHFLKKLSLYSPVVTICTAQWSLYVPSVGHYMYRTVITTCTAQWSLYVPHSCHYTYRAVVTTCTAQCSLYVPPSGHYMYRTVVTIYTVKWSLYVPPV
jgi:hypothetical protein